ncbi:TonB-dependent receptor [Sphingorhabdus sp.]|jgi:iron complex outermembrane receptor protein|uniref:TonB-dependent receptor n=1 Tax=Sphingorhabdus sp. TaxID=1902408 RepID=UPI003BAF83C7|nr:TonB-dependent receptor [Sphingomonadales bacterium]MBK9432098.1 TonB-dependent receptor [Sphingomonadales bacterium]MBL0023376.1 TonB-dependent receptor [Sphingomonadales bacterium]
MRRIRQLFVTTTALASAATFFASTPAIAQDEAAADDGTLTEIVVTAQRREENLQDVPLSVTAVSGDQLASIQAGGVDIRGISGRVPSLLVESSYGRTFPRFYIRGLGNTDFDFNAAQPVSLVYDDVVLENPILKGFPIFDLERVEVLRGPQGTLFGRNTPAGIVKFDSVKPKDEFGGYGRLSYGRFNAINAQGAVGGPLGEKVSVRLSAMYQTQDDYVDNVLPGGTTKNAFEGYDEFAARLQFLIKPTENLDILLTGQVRSLDGTARLFRGNIFTRGQAGLNSNFDRYSVSIDAKNEQSVDTQNASARITWDAGPVSLISVTSLWRGDATSVGDVDGGFGANFLPPNLYGPGEIPFTAETRDSLPSLSQFTQELRIASNGDGPLSYQAGVFYFDEDLEIVSHNYSTLGDPNNATGGVNIIVSQEQNSKAYGVFGSLTYQLSDQFSVTGGLRYNDDKRRFVAVRSKDTQFPNFLQNPLGTVNRRVSDNNMTWDLSATYAMNDDVNLYARVARGYRAPSIQGRILFPPATATPLEDGVTVGDSETITSYEGGIKSTLLDGKARFNLNGFYYELKDAQLTAVGGGINANRLINANKVRGYGFEADLEFKPVPELLLTAGLSYNNTKIRDAGLTTAACGATRVDTFPNVSLCTPLDPIVVAAAPFSAAIVNINGNSLPQSPKWIVNWTARYGVPVGNGEVYAYTDWAYRSKINFFLYDSVEFQDKQMLEGGVRVGYKTENYDFAAFVRNITKDTSAVGGIDFNNLTGFVNEPRIWGIEAGFKF